MKHLMILAAAGAALLAGSAMAQGSAAPTPAPPSHDMHMSNMSDAEMHAHCKEVMGHKMDGRAPHSHSTDKMGHTPPAAIPPSEGEMKAMHDRCAAMMAQEPTAKPK